MNEKLRALVLRLEINNGTSKVGSQNLSAETYELNLEITLTKTTDPNNKSTPQLGKYSNYCLKANQCVSNYFRKQREDKEGKRNLYSRLQSPVKPFNQNFKAC